MVPPYAPFMWPGVGRVLARLFGCYRNQDASPERPWRAVPSTEGEGETEPSLPSPAPSQAGDSNATRPTSYVVPASAPARVTPQQDLPVTEARWCFPPLSLVKPPPELLPAGIRDGGERELYEQTVTLVVREGKASTSFIQRHLNIGYDQAAKLVEQMERDEIVSPANHVGKREVLVRCSELAKNPDDALPGVGCEKRGLYERAVTLVVREGKASTSFIQRHLNIGYDRAAKLVEQMERDEIVSPANHVGKREVLVRRASEE